MCDLEVQARSEASVARGAHLVYKRSYEPPVWMLLILKVFISAIYCGRFAIQDLALADLVAVAHCYQ